MGTWRQRAWLEHGGTWVPLALALAGCDVVLLRGLTREEALKVADALDRSGVVARVVPESGSGLSLEVSETAVADAVAALAPPGPAVDLPGGRAPTVTRSSWLETPSEERARHAERLEHTLERSLLQFPEVALARVHLTLAGGLRAIPEAQTRPAASVLLVRASAADKLEPLGSAAQELIAGAVPGLSPSVVRVVETRRTPAVGAPQFARIGPIVVTRGSAGTLKGWFAASLILHMILAAALLRLLRRLRRRPAPDQVSTPPASD